MRLIKPIETEKERKAIEAMVSFGMCLAFLFVSVLGFIYVAFMESLSLQQLTLFDFICIFFGFLIGAFFGKARVRLLELERTFRFALINEATVALLVSLLLLFSLVVLTHSQVLSPSFVRTHTGSSSISMLLYASIFSSAVTMLFFGAKIRRKSK